MGRRLTHHQRSYHLSPVLNSGSSRLFHRIAKIAAAASLFVLMNGHFGVLQTMAWSKMLLDYTRANGSLIQGAKQTFDGNHPCSMCHSIAKAKENEKKSPVLATTIKFELFSEIFSDPIPWRDCQSFSYPHPENLAADLLMEAPPSPIPIFTSLFV